MAMSQSTYVRITPTSGEADGIRAMRSSSLSARDDEAFELIDNAKTFINSLDGSRLQGGPARNKFHSLFEVEEVTNAEEVDTEDPNDDALVAMENTIMEK
jgi:hypothetical protein